MMIDNGFNMREKYVLNERQEVEMLDSVYMYVFYVYTFFLVIERVCVLVSTTVNYYIYKKKEEVISQLYEDNKIIIINYHSMKMITKKKLLRRMK